MQQKPASRAWTPKIRGALIGLIILFFIFEIGVRLFFFKLPYANLTQVSGVRLWGIAGVPLGELYNNHNQYCIGDERLYAKLLPGLRDEQVRIGEATYHLTTYDLGFGDAGFRIQNPEGPWNGVAVGDSLTFCWGVEISECWVTYLQEYAKLRLVNMGVAGTAGTSHLRYLQDYGWALNPQIVIWEYSTNDPYEDFSHVAAGQQGCPHWDTSGAGEVRGTVKQFRLWLSRTFATYDLVIAPLLRRMLPQLASKQTIQSQYKEFTTTDNERVFAWVGHPPPRSAKHLKGLEITHDALLQAATEAAAHDSRFLLILAPSTLQTHINVLPTEELKAKAHSEEADMDAMLAFALQHQIEVLDLRPAIRQEEARGTALYLEHEIHWSPEGNRFVAALVAERLQEMGLSGQR